MIFQNLNALRHFEATARHLNLRRAAQELEVTQGAISQQIKRLEDTLQVKLFTRHPTGLALTDIGARMHPPVKEALDRIQETIDNLKPLSTRVSLATTPTIATRWLAPRLARLAQAQPGIDLHIITGQRKPAFDRDGVDMVIGLGPLPADTATHAERLAPVRLVAVTGPSLIARAPVLPRASFFAQYPLIEGPDRTWQAWFAREAPGMDYSAINLTQTALAIDAAEDGQGIALVPDMLVRDGLARGQLVKLREDPVMDGHGVYLLRPAKAFDNEAQRAVADWIRSELRP